MKDIVISKLQFTEYHNKLQKKPSTLTQMLSCEYNEFFKNIYFEEHMRATASEIRHFISQLIYDFLQNKFTEGNIMLVKVN